MKNVQLEQLVFLGNKLIYKEKQDEFRELVYSCSGDYYRILEIVYALQIMNSIKYDQEDLLSSLKLFYGQDHSNFTFYEVRKIILDFSSRGPDFFIATTDKKISENNMAYINKVREENKVYEANAKVFGWIKKFQEITCSPDYPDLFKYIKDSPKGKYHGKELDSAYIIMNTLDKTGDLNLAKELFLSIDAEEDYKELVKNIVLNYSLLGPEFYEEISKSKEEVKLDKAFVEDLKIKNKHLKLLNRFLLNYK